MGLEFERPDPGSALRQGEILRDVWEHRPAIPPEELDENTVVELDSSHHAFVVAITPDCDLYQDFSARYPDRVEFPTEEVKRKFKESGDRYNLVHVLLCDALLETEIRGKMPGGDVWRRVKQNQDERFHRLGPGTIKVYENQKENYTEIDLFMDFKRIFATPLSYLYASILDKQEKRFALLPPPYLQDLIHRFNCFQSRVALPD